MERGLEQEEGSSEDLEIYRRAYRWWQEQELLSKEGVAALHRRDAEEHRYSPQTSVMWNKRGDGVCAPVPQMEARMILGAPVPVVPHAWQLREDGVYYPYPENPFCEPRRQTEQVWIDASGARRPNGVLNDNRRNHIQNYGLPVLLKLQCNQARTHVRIELLPRAGFGRMSTRKVRRAFHL